ncbi:MAG TPA: DUF2889 domain-containing protein [Geobacteraceae bacterium]
MQLNSMEDFQRDISYRALKREDGQVSLTALLRDRFHDIEVRVVADLDTLTITAAGVDVRKSPTLDCRNVAERLDGLVGFTIGKGLNRKLMEVLGGGAGCGNIRNLLLGLLPLAMNVRASAGINDERDMLDTIHEKLLGTCTGYTTPPVRLG